MIARNDTASAISLFERETDHASRDIATRILIDSAEHVDFLECQLDLLKATRAPELSSEFTAAAGIQRI
jgi:bacterioferritin (cytochrome b1)